LSLDVFRGLTILAMILVNHPGSEEQGMTYAPLLHSAWHGWTITDLVFPFFLMIVGMSLAYSLRKWRRPGRATREIYARIFRRSGIIFFLGVGKHLFNNICAHAFVDPDLPIFGTLRYLGVLQRIGLVYLCAALVVLNFKVRTQVIISIATLLGYWAVLAWLPNPHDHTGNLSPEGNIVRAVDLKIMGINHVSTRATTEKTDPLGIVSTPSSIVLALAGYWAGLFIQRRGVNWRTVLILVACGLGLAIVGQAWHELLPINKKLWTSSYIVLSSGLALVGLAVCLAIFDIGGYRRLARSFEIAGVNAISVYLGSELLATVLGATHVGGTTTQQWVFQHLFVDHIADPKIASLGYALMVVAFWWLVLWTMSRRGWAIRV
jgi:predicted acyltransferase